MIGKDLIKLNVGGISFVTSISTLEKCNTPIFNEVLNEYNISGCNEIFIDRDGTYFNIILNYLRSNKLVCPDDKYILEQLLNEAQYYQILSLVDEIKAKIISKKLCTLEIPQSNYIPELVDTPKEKKKHFNNHSLNYSQDNSGLSRRNENNENVISLNTSANMMDRHSSWFSDDLFTNILDTPSISAPYYISESQDIEEALTFTQTCDISQLGPQIFDTTAEDF